MKCFKRIFSFVSALASVWVVSWLSVLLQTGLANPDWQEKADSLAIGVSAFSALVYVVFLAQYPRRAHGIMVIGMGFNFVISLAAVWWVRGEFVDATVTSEIEGWNDLWHDVFVVMLLSVSVTVLAAIFWLLGDKSDNEPSHPSRIKSS